MTKDEAIKAMREGKKVTHRYLADHEWVKMLSAIQLETEDGVIHDYSQFWVMRSHSGWQNDWKIFEV